MGWKWKDATSFRMNEWWIATKTIHVWKATSYVNTQFFVSKLHFHACKQNIIRSRADFTYFNHPVMQAKFKKSLRKILSKLNRFHVWQWYYFSWKSYTNLLTFKCKKSCGPFVLVYYYKTITLCCKSLQSSSHTMLTCLIVLCFVYCTVLLTYAFYWYTK